MRKIYHTVAILLAFIYVGCDNANELLDQHIGGGPIVYAGKINELNIQSGYYRVRANIYPAQDVNRSHSVLSWNITSGIKDSIRVDYSPSNYDEECGCYFAIVPLPDIEGNLLIQGQNVDKFGNRSLVSDQGAFVYGGSYVATLLNLPVRFSATGDVLFENRMGVVGHVISYETNNGQFTPDIVVNADRYTLEDAKVGGRIRSKTRYLITSTDLDTLVTPDYRETIMP